MALRIADIGDGRANRDAADAALEDAVTVVAATRPHLVDAWEAATVAESLGYTPNRVRRELGFADTHAFGEFLFEQLANRPIPAVAEEMSPALAPGASAAARAWAFSCLAYALLWSAAHALERSVWAPGQTATLSLMASLIVAAGIASAIQRRGHFYAALDQPALAKMTGAYMWRVGALLTLAVAAGSVALGGLFGVAPWRQLVLWADGFLLASAAVVTIALATVGVVWPVGRKRPQARTAFPLPRMTVVLSGTMPRVATVSAGFALMFSERLYASAAGAGWSGSLVPLDAAVLAMLLGMASVQGVAVAFSRDISRATSEPAGAAAGLITRAGRRSHTIAHLFSGTVYAGICAAIAPVLIGWFDVPPAAFAVAVAGGLPFILALVNAHLLHTLRRPGIAIASLGAGVAVAVITAMATAHLGVPAGTATGAGAVVAFVTSMVAVRRAVRYCDRALLVA